MKRPSLLGHIANPAITWFVLNSLTLGCGEGRQHHETDPQSHGGTRSGQQGERRDVSVACGVGRAHNGLVALLYVCTVLRSQLFDWGPRSPTKVRRGMTSSRPVVSFFVCGARNILP